MAHEPSPQHAGVAKRLRLPFAVSEAWRLPSLRSPWYAGWTVLAVCLLFQPISFSLPFICFTFFAEQWVAEFGVPRSEIMLATTVPIIVGAAMGPFAGRAFDTLSIRGLVAGGLTALTLGLLLLSAASAAWQVVAIYAAFMSLAMVFAGNLPSQILAARWFPERRGLAMGLASTGFPIGGMVLPPLVAWMLLALGWRQTFVLFAIFCMAVVVPLVLAVVRNEPPARAGAHAHPAKAQGPAADSQEFTVRQILCTRNFWILVLVVIPIMTGLMGFQANLAAYAAERGIATAQAARLLSLMAFVLLGARFIWGYLADRVEHRLLFAVAAAGSAAAYAILAFSQGVVGVGATMLLLGLGSGGLLPLMGASLSYQFRRSLGRATGLIALFMPLSSFGAPAVARAQEALGNYAPALVALAAFVLLAGVAALFLKSPRPDRAPAQARAG